MSFFSRKSASSSSSTLNKDVGPVTTDIFTTLPKGATVKNRREYNAEQLAQIEELKKYTATITLPESDPYYVWEQRFLNDVGTHARYMRASGWKLENSKNRIKATMEWRREYKPELIEPTDVSPEAETGKIVITGFDMDGRTIIYMRPRRENTDPSPRQIRHLIFCLERAIDLMPEGQEQVAIVVDYRQATSAGNPSISTGLKVLSILQHHYVERLGRGLVVNMPWWINAFFSGITPFMDPITRDKIRFNPKLTELIADDQLDIEYGGTYNFKFEHAPYWKALTEFCALTPDGKRVDPQGNPWVPPSGNGIQWAREQLAANPNGAAAPAPAAAVDATAAPAPATNGAAAPSDADKLAAGVAATNLDDDDDDDEFVDAPEAPEAVFAAASPAKVAV